ncbi:MAG: carboxypeptidase regulatory-like domain-containing protein [Luteibaculum sp.]
MNKVLFYIAFFCAFLSHGFAQMSDPPVKLQGIVTDKEGSPIPGARVSVSSKTEQVTITDLYGRFTFNRLAQGKQVILVYSLGFAPLTDTVLCSANESNALSYRLEPLSTELGEVEITSRQPEFLERLRSIRGTILFASKKNDVVRPGDMIANTGANNARQIYAKVSGLNIWESDFGGNQLEIGGRGLSPSRTSNFNTRQNGYDISADPLGYPESYYTPPADAIDQIDITRGAASLQFGSQFGGVINFILKDKEGPNFINGESKQTVGSFGLINSYNAVGVEKGKHKFFGFANLKKSEGWKDFSENESQTLYGKYQLKASRNLSVSAEITSYQYLAQQPGGLTDRQFVADPFQVTRKRNWFRVSWKMPAIHLDWKINSNTSISHKTFALVAERQALGFLAAPNVQDPADFSYSEEFQKQRNLIADQFNNLGSETRILHWKRWGKRELALSTGFRYYRGKNTKEQGQAGTGDDAAFQFISEDFPGISSYQFTNHNAALFTEGLFYLNPKTSITAGLRYEYISTGGDGAFRQVIRNPSNAIVFDSTFQDQLNKDRDFIIAGFGFSRRLKPNLEVYANFSQNYRSITFNDVVLRNPSFRIDPSIQDERGFNLDLGLKGMLYPGIAVDITAFYLKYANRIGLLLATDEETFQVYRLRTNIGESQTVGIESLVEINPMAWINPESEYIFNAFANISVLNGRYKSEDASIDGNKVELVPDVSYRFGLNLGYKNFSASLQYSYVNDHFSDATNAFETPNGISGIIPSYQVLDLGMKYTWRSWALETGVNNLANTLYFTRRATGYPGPGIIPANPRNFYLSLGLKF